MEDSRADLLLRRLAELERNAKESHTNKNMILVDREELRYLVKTLSEVLRQEIKEYRKVNDIRARIIRDAQKQAEDIKYEAEKSASRIRVTRRRPDEPPGFRVQELSDEDKKALRTANDIYAASLIYTDEMLTEVDHLVNEAYRNIEREYSRMKDTLAEKIVEISDSKTELMNQLDDLSKMERYSQILEIGHLLSHELYYEKEKARAEEKEKEAQMEILFDDDNKKKKEKRRPAIKEDRSEVRIETRKAEKPQIRVMDRSGEVKKDDEED